MRKHKHRKRKKQKVTTINRETLTSSRQRTLDSEAEWIQILNKHNGGHSETIFGIILNSNGEYITGRR